jgi:hypothetical protein
MSVLRALRKKAVVMLVVTQRSVLPRRLMIASHIATSAAPMIIMPFTIPPGRSNEEAYGTTTVHSPGAQD